MIERVPKVSIVIRSYNEARFIGQLFVGLQRQTFRDFEVIVVDSGSTDGTVEIARQFGARIVPIPKAEFSFGRSLNIGCSAARGEILLFASAHVYPTRTDWIEAAIRPFADPNVGIVYGKQRGNEITKFSERQIFIQWFPEEATNHQAHPFCNNANCAVRRSLWERLGGYDEMLTGLEDLAFAKEMMRRGHRIAYAPDAEIIHVHDEDWGRVRNRYFREAIAIRQIEPALRFGLIDFLKLTVGNIISDLRAAARQGLLSREAGNIMRFRYNQFRGTYMGYRYHAPMTRELRNRFYFPAQAETIGAANDDGAGGPLGADAPLIDYGSDPAVRLDKRAQR